MNEITIAERSGELLDRAHVAAAIDAAIAALVSRMDSAGARLAPALEKQPAGVVREILSVERTTLSDSSPRTWLRLSGSR